MLRKVLALSVTIFTAAAWSDYSSACNDESAETPLASLDQPGQKDTKRNAKRAKRAGADNAFNQFPGNNAVVDDSIKKFSPQSPLQFFVDPRVADHLKPIHEKIVAAANTHTMLPTKARLDFFRSHDKPDRAKVIGWSAILMAAEETPGGILITVCVSAMKYGQVDSLHCVETYYISQNKMSLVDFDAPRDQPRVIFGF